MSITIDQVTNAVEKVRNDVLNKSPLNEYSCSCGIGKVGHDPRGDFCVVVCLGEALPEGTTVPQMQDGVQIKYEVLGKSQQYSK